MAVPPRLVLDGCFLPRRGFQGSPTGWETARMAHFLARRRDRSVGCNENRYPLGCLRPPWCLPRQHAGSSRPDLADPGEEGLSAPRGIADPLALLLEPMVEQNAEK